MSLTGSNEQWSVVVFIKAFNVGSSAENQWKMLDVVEMLFNISVLLFSLPLLVMEEYKFSFG